MNSMPENQKSQTLVLRDRRLLELDGVSDVVGFDEATLLLRTVMGALTVEGEGLHVIRLDLEKGLIALEGKISAVFYADEHKSERHGLFARLAK